MFLSRYIIGISGSLGLVEIIELDSYACNFTSVLANVITLMFFPVQFEANQNITEPL